MALTFEAGVSLLKDVVLTMSYTPAAGMTPAIGDTGVLSTFTTSTIFNVDKISVKRSAAKSDHSGGQNPEMIMRTTKYNTEVELELKLYVDATEPVLAVDLQVTCQFVATINSNMVTGTILGIISDVAIEVSGPSTYKISIKPYAVGGAPSYTLVYTA